MAVSDYSTTASDNTSISGLTVTDATVADTLDNIIRQLMADVRAADDANAKTADNETISGDWTVSGDWTLSGSLNVTGSLTGLGGVSALTATTSGTSFDFTSIPTGVVRVDVSLVGVSLDGTNSFLVQIGDSGGIEATGYSASSELGGSVTDYTTGFGIATNGAATGNNGLLTLVLADASTNTWVASHSTRSGSGATANGGGSKALSATLDRVRVTRSGSDNFDAGSISVRWSKV